MSDYQIATRGVCGRGCVSEYEFGVLHEGTKDREDLVLRSFSPHSGQEVTYDTGPFRVCEEW